MGIAEVETPIWDVLREAASGDPRRAVFEAYDALAGATIAAACATPATVGKLGPAPTGERAARALVASNLIEPEVFETFVQLRDLRNVLVNSARPPVPADARRYVDLARTVSTAISAAGVGRQAVASP